MVTRGLLDLDMVRRLMASAKGSIEAKVIKNKARDIGFNMSMSLYGVLTTIDDGRSEYRRIEILADANLSSQDVEYLYRWFRKAHPVKTYSIWLYHTKSQRLTQVFETW